MCRRHGHLSVNDRRSLPTARSTLRAQPRGGPEISEAGCSTTRLLHGAQLHGRLGRFADRATNSERKTSYDPKTDTRRIRPAAIVSGASLGQHHSYRDAYPRVAPSAQVAGSAELVGDVGVGEHTIIAGGVRIIGGSWGVVRIGARVTILENTVLRPLPGSDLVIEDDVIIGPGTILQGCHVENGTVVEAGALIDGWSRIGAESLVGTGACVKQRSVFPARSVIDGSPADVMGRLRGPLRRPDWAPEVSHLPVRRDPDPSTHADGEDYRGPR